MPRCVRNFWIEIEVDGKTHKVACGPRSKDGGFRLVVKQRDDGCVIKAMEVQGFADDKGNIRLDTFIGDGQLKSFTTRR